MSMKLKEKIILIFQKLKKNLKMSAVLQNYAAFLKTITGVLKISARFLFSIFSIFKDFFNLDFTQILKLITVLAFYSRIVLILSSVVPCPGILVGFATEYWGLIVAISSSVPKFIKETMQIYNDGNTAMQLLEEEKILFRESLSKQLDLLNQQTKYIKDLQESHDSTLLKLQGDLQLKDEINRKISLENSELTEKVKVMKLTTSFEKIEKFLVVGGNVVFIAIQCFNAYNSFTKSPSMDPNEVKLLVSSVNSLLDHINNSRVNRTAFERAQSQSGTPAEDNAFTGNPVRPVTGLTDTDINFDEEFGP